MGSGTSSMPKKTGSSKGKKPRQRRRVCDDDGWSSASSDLEEKMLDLKGNVPTKLTQTALTQAERKANVTTNSQNYSQYDTLTRATSEQSRVRSHQKKTLSRSPTREGRSLATTDLRTEQDLISEASRVLRSPRSERSAVTASRNEDTLSRVTDPAGDLHIDVSAAALKDRGKKRGATSPQEEPPISSRDSVSARPATTPPLSSDRQSALVPDKRQDPLTPEETRGRSNSESLTTPTSPQHVTPHSTSTATPTHPPMAQNPLTPVRKEATPAKPTPFFDGHVERWTKGPLIGAGSYGKVYRALTNETGRSIAVKEVHVTSEQIMKDIKKEIEVLRLVNHKNIVRYLGIEKVGHSIFILMEYVPNGTLASMIKMYKTLPEPVACRYTREILEGVAYLHNYPEQAIVHRDIKGANILITAESNIKLADFGSSKYLQGGSSSKTVKGTPFWMAPEVIKEEGHGPPADIWSTGCTVIEMLSGKPPYSNMGQMQAMHAIATDTSPPPLSHLSISKEFEEFILKCLARNPDDRPTALELLDHALIKDKGAPMGTSHEAGPANAESAEREKEREARREREKEKERKERKERQRHREAERRRAMRETASSRSSEMRRPSGKYPQRGTGGKTGMREEHRRNEGLYAEHMKHDTPEDWANRLRQQIGSENEGDQGSRGSHNSRGCTSPQSYDDDRTKRETVSVVSDYVKKEHVFSDDSSDGSEGSFHAEKRTPSVSSKVSRSSRLTRLESLNSVNQRKLSHKTRKGDESLSEGERGVGETRLTSHTSKGSLMKAQSSFDIGPNDRERDASEQADPSTIPPESIASLGSSQSQPLSPEDTGLRPVPPLHSPDDSHPRNRLATRSGDENCLRFVRSKKDRKKRERDHRSEVSDKRSEEIPPIERQSTA